MAYSVFILLISLVAQLKSQDISSINNPEPSVICITPSNEYDIGSLILPPYWTFHIESGCSLVANSSDSCSLDIAFCKPFERSMNCNGASACINYENKNESVIVGNFTRDPFTIDEKNQFRADFPKGPKITNKFSNECYPKVSVQFVCNESVVWQLPFTGYPGTVPKPFKFTQITNSSCDIYIEVPYSGACSIPNPDKRKAISSGSILIIIFVISVTLYLGTGVIYNVATKKQLDINSIPNYEFWSSILGNIKAGFIYTWAIVSGKNMKINKDRKYESI